MKPAERMGGAAPEQGRDRAAAQIRAALFARQDLGYKAFTAKLIPTVAPERIIGVRTPQLRAYAKEVAATPLCAPFLDRLPKDYFDELQLHALILEGLRDFEEAWRRVAAFVPHIDNWATCDIAAPRVFKKNRAAVLERLRPWLGSEHAYTQRYAIGLLLGDYLDAAFSPEIPELVAAVRSEHYYVRMMQAWFFATALAKQAAATWPYLEEGRLDDWVHNKTIQKALESRRVAAADRARLRALRR